MYQKSDKQSNTKGTGEVAGLVVDTNRVCEDMVQVKAQESNRGMEQKGTGKVTYLTADTNSIYEDVAQAKAQESNRKRNIENKYNNNIYLYLYNKYKVENRKNFNEYMTKTRELRNDEKWDELTKEEQQKLLSEL